MDNKVTKIANAIERMWNKKHMGVEATSMIVDFTKDEIIGHVNRDMFFEREEKSLGYFKLRKNKESNAWEKSKLTDLSYPKLTEEYKKKKLKLYKEKACITPVNSCKN